MRAAAKWLIASGGAVVTASVAGLQLSGLTDARSAWLAVLSFVVITMAAGAVIASGSAVLAPAVGSLGDLRQREDDAAVASSRWNPPRPDAPLLLQFAYADPLFRYLYSAGFRRTPSQVLELALTEEDPAEGALTTRRMLAAVDTFEVQQRFKKLRIVCAISGAGLVIAVPILALSLDTKESPVRITEPMPVLVQFSGPAPGLGTACDTTQPLEGVAIGGSLAEPRVAFLAQGKCESATIEIRQAVGLAVPQVRP